MEITITTREDGSVVVSTLDGNFTFMPSKTSEFETEGLDIKSLIKNIWSNAKIKDSSLFIDNIVGSTED